MIQLFSVCPGMEYQPGVEWSLPVGTEQAEEVPSQERRSPRSLMRRRARATAGRFQADNPATPENEAWEQGAADMEEAGQEDRENCQQEEPLHGVD